MKSDEVLEKMYRKATYESESLKKEKKPWIMRVLRMLGISDLDERENIINQETRLAHPDVLFELNLLTQSVEQIKNKQEELSILNTVSSQQGDISGSDVIPLTTSKKRAEGDISAIAVIPEQRVVIPVRKLQTFIDTAAFCKIDIDRILMKNDNLRTIQIIDHLTPSLRVETVNYQVNNPPILDGLDDFEKMAAIKNKLEKSSKQVNQTSQPHAK